jgi:hypothetical protein
MACLKAWHHHMYMQGNKDSDQQWLPTQYRLTKKEMEHIMADWEDELKIPPIEIGPTKNKNSKIYEVV